MRLNGKRCGEPERTGDCTGKTELSDCKLEPCAGAEPYDTADRTI